MDFFYRSMAIFSRFPLLALVVSLVLFWMFLRSVSTRKGTYWPLVLPSSLWMIYAGWELMLVERTMAVRVDLLVFYPLLALTTGSGLFFWFRGLKG